MHDHDVPPDPLLSAIADLRAQVDRLIDEQKTLVGGVEAEWAQAKVAAARVAPPPPLPVEPEPKARRSTEAPRSAAPPEPVEAAPNGRPDDPRLRLDALAKHLDRKLRHAGGPPG